MSEIKLLPCPFCGGECHLYMDKFAKYFTGCEECGFYYGIEIEHDCELEHGWIAKHNTREEAIESWNTRNPMERIAEQIEFLEHRTIDGIPYINMNDAIEVIKEVGGIE